ncbi:hypothetical protein Pfo_007794 [Paulownia fortunei]|nr:hypothetical protein Pfo_007794 [Paulownia fortunei]
MKASHVTTSLCATPHHIYIHPHTDAKPQFLHLLLSLSHFLFSETHLKKSNKGLNLFIHFKKKRKKMAKILLVLFAVCVLPAIVSARFVGDPFLVKGSVYCDTCRCGYETDATKYMAGATVRIECRDRDTAQLTYTKEAVTDSTGQYSVLVQSDRGDDFCDAVLVKSSDPECSTPNEGRDRARVILTRNNGMISNTRFANNMGFLKNTPLANCARSSRSTRKLRIEMILLRSISPFA